MISICLFYIYYGSDSRPNSVIKIFIRIVFFTHSDDSHKVFSISFKVLKDCFLFKLILFSIKLFAGPIFNFAYFLIVWLIYGLSIGVALTLGLILIRAWLFGVVLRSFRNRFIEMFTSFLFNSRVCSQSILDNLFCDSSWKIYVRYKGFCVEFINELGNYLVSIIIEKYHIKISHNHDLLVFIGKFF